jgi:hypothetical protein
MTRRKWPSGHIETSGFVMNGRSGVKIVEMEAWKICRRNERNAGVRSCSRSAITAVSRRK